MLIRYLDNGIGLEPAGRQRVFNQAIMDQLMAAVNECKQPGKLYIHCVITATGSSFITLPELGSFWHRM